MALTFGCSTDVSGCRGARAKSNILPMASFAECLAKSVKLLMLLKKHLFIDRDSFD